VSGRLDWHRAVIPTNVEVTFGKAAGADSGSSYSAIVLFDRLLKL
jgi:hypothetical protein